MGNKAFKAYIIEREATLLVALFSFSAYIHQASDPSHHTTLINSDLLSPEGLALDWIQHNLYWTDSGHRTISVASSDGSRRRVLIHTDLSEPRAIAVAPEQGWEHSNQDKTQL